MKEILSHGGLLIATTISIVAAFLFTSRKARRHYGQEHVAEINSGWLIIVLSAAPMLLHLAVTKSHSQVLAIASFSELALAATLIAFLGVMELCGAFAMNYSIRIKPQRVQFIAAYVLLLYGAGLVTSVEQLHSRAVSWVAAVWNICLLVWAVTAILLRAAWFV